MNNEENAVLARLAAEKREAANFCGNLTEARALLDGSILGLLSEEELSVSTASSGDLAAMMAAGKVTKNCKCLTKGGWLGCTISVIIVASSAVCTTELTFCGQAQGGSIDSLGAAQGPKRSDDASS